MCVNLLIAGVIGGVILTGRLLKASMYLAEAMAAGVTWMIKIVCKGVRA